MSLPRTVAGSLVMSVVLAGACVHPQTVQTKPENDAGSSAARKQKTSPSGTGGSGATHNQPAKGPHLADSPSDLRPPGAKEALVKALASKGFLQSTTDVSEDALSAAIRHFQEGQGLAATGYADETTASRLGVKPEAVTHSRDARKP